MPAAMLVAPPRYVANTTILFDTGKIQIFSQPSMLETSDGLEDQIQLLQSNLIAEKVLAALGPIADREFKVPQKGRVERWFGTDHCVDAGLEQGPQPMLGASNTGLGSFRMLLKLNASWAQRSSPSHLSRTRPTGRAYRQPRRIMYLETQSMTSGRSADALWTG